MEERKDGFISLRHEIQNALWIKNKDLVFDSLR